MPSRMVHYCIGIEVLKTIDLNSQLFIIGNLAPDAHDGSPERKASTHFMMDYKVGVDKYPLANIEQYKTKYFSKRFDEFSIGYYCHLITDNLWTKSIYYKYFDSVEDEYERQSKISLFYNDYVTLNRLLQEEYNLKKIIISIPDNICVDEVSLNEIHWIISEINNDFTKTINDKDLHIVSFHFIENFIRKATEECISEIIRIMTNEYIERY